jgi:hypothetical protein
LHDASLKPDYSKILNHQGVISKIINEYLLVNLNRPKTEIISQIKKYYQKSIPLRFFMMMKIHSEDEKFQNDCIISNYPTETGQFLFLTFGNFVSVIELLEH